MRELLLPVQLQFVQRFGSSFPPEAFEFLTVDVDEVTQIAVPPKDSSKDVVGEAGVAGRQGLVNTRGQRGTHRRRRRRLPVRRRRMAGTTGLERE